MRSIYYRECHAAAFSRSSVSALKTSGRIAFKYKSRALGIPFLRQSLTEAGRHSHNSATAEVPPRSSIIWFALFMVPILGMTKCQCQGIPNFYFGRIGS